MRRGDPGPGSRCVWEGRGWSVFVSDRFGVGRSVSVYRGEGLVVDATLDPYDAPRAGVELRGRQGPTPCVIAQVWGLRWMGAVVVPTGAGRVLDKLGRGLGLRVEHEAIEGWSGAVRYPAGELRGTLGDLFGPLGFAHETATMHRWVRVGDVPVPVTVEVTRQAWRRPRWPGVWASFEFVEVRSEGRTARSYEGTVGDAVAAWIEAEERAG